MLLSTFSVWMAVCMHLSFYDILAKFFWVSFATMNQQDEKLFAALAAERRPLRRHSSAQGMPSFRADGRRIARR